MREEEGRKKRLTEPPLVSSHSTRRSVLLPLLKGSGLCDLSVSISDGLSSVEKLLLPRTSGGNVEVLS